LQNGGHFFIGFGHTNTLLGGIPPYIICSIKSSIDEEFIQFAFVNYALPQAFQVHAEPGNYIAGILASAGVKA